MANIIPSARGVGGVIKHNDTTFRNAPNPHVVLSKLADVPEFQHWLKDRIGHQPDVTITGTVDENLCRALTFDGNFIWAGLYTQPFKILKINPADNTYTVITGVLGENFCDALTYDGISIWAGLDTAPAKILKINPDTNSYIVITAV